MSSNIRTRSMTDALRPRLLPIILLVRQSVISFLTRHSASSRSVFQRIYRKQLYSGIIIKEGLTNLEGVEILFFM